MSPSDHELRGPWGSIEAERRPSLCAGRDREPEHATQFTGYASLVRSECSGEPAAGRLGLLAPRVLEESLDQRAGSTQNVAREDVNPI